MYGMRSVLVESTGWIHPMHLMVVELWIDGGVPPAHVGMCLLLYNQLSATTHVLVEHAACAHSPGSNS